MPTLQESHENVPSDYYDLGIKHNVFQKIWHTHRFHQVKDFISQPSGKILDIGCHSGLFTKKIIGQSENVEIYGIDISKEAIEYAKKRIKKGKFFQGDAHSLPFPNNFFDMVFCLEMLEHVENPEQVIVEMKRVLKKEGKGIILIPTDSKLFKMIWTAWNIYSPVWKHTHIQSFNKKSIKSLLKKTGLTITKTKLSHCNMLLLIEFTK